METLKTISERRSIRKYKNTKIDDNILIEAINYGIKAPSAHNRQPWKFRILKREEINHIADLLEEKTKSIEGHTGPHTANVMRTIPSMILVVYDNNIKEHYEMDMLSIGACIENIILYLTDKDLGTLWIGNTNLVNEEIKKYLNLDLNTISCIGVGEKGQSPHERPRKSLEDIIIK